jgi:hypothetical protein
MNQVVRRAAPAEGADASSLPVRPLYRLTVAQYHRMIEGGILPPGARTELLDGYLVGKMTPNPPHASAVIMLTQLLYGRSLAGWVIRVEAPITLKESQPEPDVAIVRGPVNLHTANHPGPRDVALAVEVADTSLLDDRRYKATLYARARIALFWIVNLVDGRVEVYASPKAGKNPAYQSRQDYERGRAVPLVLGGQSFGELAVDELLPLP